jgi:hypothetical protein
MSDGASFLTATKSTDCDAKPIPIATAIEETRMKAAIGPTTAALSAETKPASSPRETVSPMSVGAAIPTNIAVFAGSWKNALIPCPQ